MCNLYSLDKKRDAVARFFRVSHNRAAAFEPVSAIFPRHVAPVVRQTADGEREIATMSWGFMLLQNGRAPRPVTNVRDDTILKSSFWKLVATSEFGVVVRNAYVSTSTFGPSFFTGRLYLRQIPGNAKSGRASLPSIENQCQVAGLTINHERMPVLLTREEEFETWLRAPAEEALALAQEYPWAQMRIVQEGLVKEDLLNAA